MSIPRNKFVPLYLFLFLSQCLFFVHYAQAATYYVSTTTVNGFGAASDSNNGTSSSTPWLTLSHANSTVADGDSVIVNDGLYPANGIFVSKGYTLNPLNPYAVTLHSNTLYAFEPVITDGSTLTIGKLIIDMQNQAATYGILPANESTLYGLTLNGTEIINTKKAAIDNRATLINLNVNNCILTSTSTVGYGLITQQDGSPLASSSVVMVNGCTITNDIGSGTIGNSGVYLVGTTGVSATVKNNTIVNGDGSNGGLQANAGIVLVNIPSVTVASNTITLNIGTGQATSTAYGNGILVQSASASTVDSSYPSITNNIVYSNIVAQTLSGHLIMVGTDGSGGVTDNKTNYATIANNTVVSNGTSTDLHGITIGSQTGGWVYGNKIINASHGLLAKLTTGPGPYFYDNVVLTPSNNANTAECLRMKGANGAVFFNNVCYLTVGQGGYGMLADEDPTIPTYTTNGIFSNNIIYADAPPNVSFAAVGVAGNSASFYNNDYYLTAGTLPASGWQYNGTDYGTFAAWSGAHELTGLNVNPLFNNPAGNDYSLLASSSMIDAGTTTPVTSVDFLGNPIYGLPDIGAYEYQPSYTMGTNEIDIGAGARVYLDGKFRNRATSSGILGHFSVSPISGSFISYTATSTRPAWLDISSTTWSLSGNYLKQWVASSSIATSTIFTIGDLQVNAPYTIAVDGSAVLVSTSSATSSITYTYTGGYTTPHTFTITQNLSPTIGVPTISSINQTSAVLTGDILANNGATSTIEGFNYGTTIPYTSNVSTTGAYGVGTFVFTINGLLCATTYHVQAYAVNPLGTATSSDQSFQTEPCSVPGGGGGGGGGYILAPMSVSSSTFSVQLLTNPLATLFFTRDLATTSTGVDVKTIQNILIAQGYLAAGYNTGYFGPLTSEALMVFQKQHGMSPTGVFGSTTRALFNTIVVQKAPATASISMATSTKFQFNHPLHLGLEENDVQSLQQFLNTHGFIVTNQGSGSPGHESTYFGVNTQNALIKFQQYYASKVLAPYGITSPTGYFGTHTMGLVNSME